MNTSMQKILVASVFSVALFGCSSNGYSAESNNAFTSANSTAGNVLANASGMTLYTFDKDAKGKSNCYGSCATVWPPATASANAMASGPYSTVVRQDGTYQWAYQDQPLYTWVNDSKSGDITGDGVGGVWHIVPLID